MWFETTRVFLTVGEKTGGTKVNAFDNALRQAGIQAFNLIRISSIIPPDVPVSRLVHSTKPVHGDGLIVPVVYESLASDKIGTEISAAVGVGLPLSGAGMVFAHQCEGPREEAERVVRAMIAEGMPNMGYAEYEVQLVSTSTLVVAPWSAVVAAALYCDKEIERLFA